uniref:LITAF domain-containing protein n=1 Tax=Rhodosorus marinus TaxID=101924 RepID=A0A7S3EKX5_9RHOD|mmetsp:Transcript_44132/g.172103  ORF Transcript_44132/g.172103 Transcript_44132/m.172103 type:complete len:190 (+) Transcript_44132:225-794(+)
MIGNMSCVVASQAWIHFCNRTVRDTSEPVVNNSNLQQSDAYNQMYQQQVSLNTSQNYPSVRDERIEDDVRPHPAPAPTPAPKPPAPAPAASATAPKATPPPRGGPDGSAQHRNLGKRPVVVECPSCRNRKRSKMKFNHCTTANWTYCLISSIFCLGWMAAPFIFTDCCCNCGSDVSHTCPECGFVLGTN